VTDIELVGDPKMTTFVNTGIRVQSMLIALFLISALTAADADQSLIRAVKNQDGDTARALIARNVDVNTPQVDGATALHWAVHRDDLETAKLLLAAGADVDAVNDIGVMPLSLACENGSASMVETLLNAGADSNAVLMTGETVLMRASFSGDLDTVDLLLEHGADVNAKEPVRKQSALMWALDRQRMSVVRHLVQHGADVHAPTTLGFTPLMFAARHGSVEAATLILDADADVNATNTDKLSVLHVAVQRGHGTVAALLLERGADPNADGPGYTALHWAVGTWDTELTGRNGMTAPKGHAWERLNGVKDGKGELVNALLEAGADPNAVLVTNPKVWGYTIALPAPNSRPMTLAAYAGEGEIVQLLAKHGADVSLRPDNDFTTLMIAAGASRISWISRVTEDEAVETAKAVLEIGADVNEKNGAGNTALHEAAKKGSTKLVQFLVDYGADMEAKNGRGQRAIDVSRFDADHQGLPENIGKRPPVRELLQELSALSKATKL
jgi:ankyrin repeat protein